MQRGWEKPPSEVKTPLSRPRSMQVLTLLPSFLPVYINYDATPTVCNLSQKSISSYSNYLLLSTPRVPNIYISTLYNEPTRNHDFVYYNLLFNHHYVPRSSTRPIGTLSLAVCCCVCLPQRAKPATLPTEDYKLLTNSHQYLPLLIKILFAPKSRNIRRCLLNFKNTAVTFLFRRITSYGGPRPWHDCSRTSYRRNKTKLLSAAHIQVTHSIQGRLRPWNDCPRTSYRRYKAKEGLSTLNDRQGLRGKVLPRIGCTEAEMASRTQTVALVSCHRQACNPNSMNDLVEAKSKAKRTSSRIEPRTPTHECCWPGAFPLRHQYTSTILHKNTCTYSNNYEIHVREHRPRTTIQLGKTSRPRLTPMQEGMTSKWYVNKSIHILANSNCSRGPGDDCYYLDNG